MNSRPFLVALLALPITALSAGCATSTDDAEGGDEQDVTGVTDLAELEAAVGLRPDTKNAQGVWSRGDAKLKAGTCYKSVMSGAGAATHQFRRYANGAAFFSVKGTTPETGDKRPILCVDVDLPAGNGWTTEHAASLTDFDIDATIRYRMGRPQGKDGAAGSSYATFDNGHLRYGNQFCDASFDPASTASLSSQCFSEAVFPGSNYPDTQLMQLAYAYATRAARKSDKFSFSDDPLGRFVSMETQQKGAGGNSAQQIHYEKLDAKVVYGGGGLRTIAITPKDGTGLINEQNAKPALAVCTENAQQKFSCKGI